MKLVHMSVPHFHGYHLRDGSTDHLVLIANGTSIQESHRTVANKEAVLNWLFSLSQDSVQREQAEIPTSQSFPEKSLFGSF